MILKCCEKILLVVLFYEIEFLTVLYQLRNYQIKDLRSFETCVLVNNNLCRKLFSSLKSPTRFDANFKIFSVPFFIPDFNLLSCELDNSTFKVIYQVILLLRKKIKLENCFFCFYNNEKSCCICNGISSWISCKVNLLDQHQVLLVY